jgi:hypothetical protein
MHFSRFTRPRYRSNGLSVGEEYRFFNPLVSRRGRKMEVSTPLVTASAVVFSPWDTSKSTAVGVGDVTKSQRLWNHVMYDHRASLAGGRR